MTDHAHACIGVDRVQRLKDARREAAEELELLKRTKNDEYGRFEEQVLPMVC